MADALTTWTLVAETREWVGPITLSADGVPVTAFEVTVTEPGARPGTGAGWVAPTVLEGQRGVLVGTGTPFVLRVGRKCTIWARFSDTPEAPVERVGIIKVI